MNRICEEKTVTSEGVESVLTEEAFVLAAKEVIYLASCVVNGELPDRDRAAGMNLHHLFAVAHAHQMTAITAIALEKAGVKDEAFTQAKGKAIRKNASLDIDRSALFARLEEEKIWYMPLKGAVLAGYYPAFGMRQMSDNDILIDKSRAKDVKEIMKSLGYEVEAFGKGVHDEYVKKPVCFFVIHRALFNQNEKRLYEYYKDVEARLIKAEGTFERHFSIEDFYVYLLAHDYRHYSDSGTGLRSLLDIYLFWRKNGQRLDMNYTENQLATLGILGF